MASLELSVGKRYRNHWQQLVTIVSELDEVAIPKHLPDLAEYPFLGFNQTTGAWNSYTIRGYVNRYEENEDDLVAETEDVA